MNDVIGNLFLFLFSAPVIIGSFILLVVGIVLHFFEYKKAGLICIIISLIPIINFIIFLIILMNIDLD